MPGSMPSALRYGGIVAEDDGGGIEKGDERVADDFLPQVHGERKGLDGEVVAVAVHDQAGEAVGLGPDEAGKRFIDAALFAVLDGLGRCGG
jgi:hypothetical protein